MNISGKLFGRIGRMPMTAGTRISATARPGFCRWYSLQLAKCYAVSVQDPSPRQV